VKLRDGALIGMLVGRQVAKRHIFIGSGFDLARTTGLRRVAPQSLPPGPPAVNAGLMLQYPSRDVQFKGNQCRRRKFLFVLCSWRPAGAIRDLSGCLSTEAGMQMQDDRDGQIVLVQG